MTNCLYWAEAWSYILFCFDFFTMLFSSKLFGIKCKFHLLFVGLVMCIKNDQLHVA